MKDIATARKVRRGFTAKAPAECPLSDAPGQSRRDGLALRPTCKFGQSPTHTDVFLIALGIRAVVLAGDVFGLWGLQPHP